MPSHASLSTPRQLNSSFNPSSSPSQTSSQSSSSLLPSSRTTMTRPILLTESDDEATDEEEQIRVQAQKRALQITHELSQAQLKATMEARKKKAEAEEEKAKQLNTKISTSSNLLENSGQQAQATSSPMKLDPSITGRLLGTSSQQDHISTDSTHNPASIDRLQESGSSPSRATIASVDRHCIKTSRWEDEDSEMTRLLMQRAEQMQKQALQPAPIQQHSINQLQAHLSPSLPQIPQDGSFQSHIEVKSGGLTTSVTEISHTQLADAQSGRIVVLDDRKKQAAAYLESLVISFLTQLHKSQAILDRFSKVKTSQPKGKRKANGSDAEEDEEEDEEDQDGVGNRSGSEASDEESGVEVAKPVSSLEPGIEMRLKNRKTGSYKIISFPDNPLASAKKEKSLQQMARVLRVASLLYEAIYSGCVTTKRDIYYKDVGLFKVQANVDALVDDIVGSAGLKRQDFNVCATSKGLIASGVLQITLKTGGNLSLSTTTASLIPPVERIEGLHCSEHLDWVLIVEKDAVFQTLCSSGLLEDQRIGKGALLTGKGYPDLATLQLVARLSIDFPNAKLYALVDGDPHGLDILSVYTNGSRATQYSHDHADLALGDRLEWIGVKSSELSRYGVKHDDLLHLTAKDVQKVTYNLSLAMLRHDIPLEWRRELSHMLHINRKAEIQILCGATSADSQLQPSPGIFGGIGADSSSGLASKLGCGASGLVEYIVSKLQTGRWGRKPVLV